MSKNNTTRNACIATVLAVGALIGLSPAVAADDEPTVEEDQHAHWGDCFDINPWAWPPAIAISPLDCIRP